MWSTQRLDIGPGNTFEISTSATEILRLASYIISQRRFESRYIVFPLFMAGFASTTTAERVSTLKFLEILEQDAIGRNTSVTRRLLIAVFEAQAEAVRRVGHCLGVDWLDVMVGRGLQVIHCGL